MELTIYGSTGFVGSAFVKRWQNSMDIHTRERWQRRPYPYGTTDILYLISTTHNYNVFTDPTLDVNTNLVVLTETLDSWKRNNPNGVFNFVSSWFVYGDCGYTDPYTHSGIVETTPCNPKGFYSITKRCAEQLVESFATTFGLKYRILRLCNIVGPGDKPSKQKNALQYLINEMKVGNTIELYEGGDFYRTYMHIDDCVEALRLVMLDGEENTIYNIGVRNPIKFKTAIWYAHEQLGSTSAIRNIHQKDFHKQVQTKSFAMNCDRLYDLGFYPKYDQQWLIESLLK